MDNGHNEAGLSSSTITTRRRRERERMRHRQREREHVRERERRRERERNRNRHRAQKPNPSRSNISHPDPHKKPPKKSSLTTTSSTEHVHSHSFSSSLTQPSDVTPVPQTLSRFTPSNTPIINTMSPTLFSSETPAPRGTLLSTELPTGLDSTLPTPPIGGDPSNPSTTKMSGTSGSPLAAILGAIVGVVALVGLIALILYRRRERKEERREAMGEDDGEEGVYDDRGNPSIREAPRTSFRHESFIALVKDAAQGLYAPSETTVPPGSVSANLAAASLDMSDSCAAAVVAGPDETGLVAVAAAECVKGGEDTGSELVRNDSAVSCHTSAGTLEYLESPASCPHLQAIDPS